MLVLGCGAIGLGIVQALKIIQPDCEVWALARSKIKRELALKLGADYILSGDIFEETAKATGGSEVYTGMGGNKYFFGGFDRVYDCVGGDWSNNTSVRLLRARGTMVKVGHHMRSVTYDDSPVWWQELSIVGVDAHGMESIQGRRLYTFDLVQEWMLGGVYKTDGFITHRFPLDDYKSAMRLAINHSSEVIKIILDCR